MYSKFRVLIPSLALLACFVLFSVSGCARTPAGNQTQASASPSPTPAPSPISVTAKELTKLRWIEGTWRGSGVDQAPFFERYKFENDTTLAVETFADETLGKVTDVSRFELKDGHFGYTTDQSGSVAVALDDKAITFAPIGKGNYFRWQRESDNSWKAVLNWTGKDGTPKERIYQMERIPPPKPLVN